MDEFCTPMQRMNLSWIDEQPSASDKTRKSTTEELQLVCDQQATEINTLRAALAQQKCIAEGCEDELRSELAAMEQIATERECSRIRLMNEMDEAVKIANLAVKEADDERASRERAESELEAERTRNCAAQQRLQNQLDACRTPSTHVSYAQTSLEQREADLAAALAHLHLRETALEAQKDEVRRQREALTQRQIEMRAMITSYGENYERSHTSSLREEEEDEGEQQKEEHQDKEVDDLAFLRMRSLQAYLQSREERVQARELDVERREAAVSEVEEDLRSSATKLRRYAHEQSLGTLSPSFQQFRSPKTMDEIERGEAQLEHTDKVIKREARLRKWEAELLQTKELLKMQAGVCQQQNLEPVITRADICIHQLIRSRRSRCSSEHPLPACWQLSNVFVRCVFADTLHVRESKLQRQWQLMEGKISHATLVEGRARRLLQEAFP